ncbi:RTA1 like protein-domain-containing protein [Phaeosphaeriaceae sp. PMI808]|nr:RTA1 like protein-domain-containing protein [Phaeosphaeriaceae sp. PMI808]
MAVENSSLEPSLYYYRPSVPLAIVGAIAFAVVAVVYLWLFVRYRAWHFWAMYVGLSMECVGFTTRVVSVRNTTSADAFVISYLALLLAPSFMAAACYATFGHLLWWVTPLDSHNVRTLWCSARIVTPLFICFDLGSFFIQLLGAGAVGTAYASKNLSAGDRQEKIRTGLIALKIGFASQLICFGMFVIIGTRFLYVSRRWAGKPLRYLAPPGSNWTRLNWAVNLAIIAITVRAAYRIVEFSNSQSPQQSIDLQIDYSIKR